MIAALNKRWLDSAFPTDAPLTLLHPAFANQHVLLEKALKIAKRTPIFVTLLPPCDTLADFWAMLSAAVHEQVNLTLPELDHKAVEEKAAQVALKAFQSVGSFTLIIDAFDIAPDTVQRWLTAFVDNLPANSQVVVSSRYLPAFLMHHPASKAKMRLFPVDPDRMLVDYAAQPPDRAVLEVYGLGPGQALINGQRIDRWDGVLPRSLFFYFIDRGMVTRDEIFQTFWPTLSVREATNVFHVTKRKISEILGFDLTVYWSGFYRISPDIDLHYDVVKFIENVQNSVVVDDEKAVDLLEQAIYLYHGLFLSMLDMEWASARRAELKLIYADALSSLGKLRQRAGLQQEALGLYLRASTTQPHREDLARGIMSLYAELGQPNKALEIYKRLGDELKHSLGVNPDRQTIDLAEQIRRA